MKTAHLIAGTLACLFAMALEGCTPSESVAARDRDNVDAPWDSPQSGGAKAEQERRIEGRTWNQSEYGRTR